MVREIDTEINLMDFVDCTHCRLQKKARKTDWRAIVDAWGSESLQNIADSIQPHPSLMLTSPKWKDRLWYHIGIDARFMALGATAWPYTCSAAEAHRDVQGFNCCSGLAWKKSHGIVLIFIGRKISRKSSVFRSKYLVAMIKGMEGRQEVCFAMSSKPFANPTSLK